MVVSTGWYALTLFRPASGSGAAPRPKGWIAAAAAGSLLSARALAPEECGQGMTLRRRGLVSRSSRLWLAVTEMLDASIYEISSAGAGV